MSPHSTANDGWHRCGHTSASEVSSWVREDATGTNFEYTALGNCPNIMGFSQQLPLAFILNSHPVS